VYLTLPEKFLDRLEQESLTGLRKESKGTTVEGQLYWIALWGREIPLNILTNGIAGPGSLMRTGDSGLVTINTTVGTTLLGDEDGDDQGSLFHNILQIQPFVVGSGKSVSIL
jgi:hypothetical protein